jgi:hypothetical protein
MTKPKSSKTSTQQSIVADAEAQQLVTAEPETPTPAKGKTDCPISREQFREEAKSIVITIDGKSYTAEPREFATGSLGWNLNDKMTVEIDGVPCKVQVGMNITLVGSKSLPQE